MTGFGAISLDGSVAAVRFERWYAASAAADPHERYRTLAPTYARRLGNAGRR